MGSYTDLSVGGYPVLETKSFASLEALTIFRESDKAIVDRKIADRNVLVWGEPDLREKNEIELAFVYRASVLVVKTRLNVMGFTLDRVQQDFHSIRDSEIAKYISWLGEEEGDSENLFNENIKGKIDLLRSISFPKYLEALRIITSQNKRIYEIKRDGFLSNDPIAEYIAADDEGFEFGFFFAMT